MRKRVQWFALTGVLVVALTACDRVSMGIVAPSGTDFARTDNASLLGNINISATSIDGGGWAAQYSVSLDIQGSNREGGIEIADIWGSSGLVCSFQDPFTVTPDSGGVRIQTGVQTRACYGPDLDGEPGGVPVYRDARLNIYIANG